MLFGYSNAFYDIASIYELDKINQKDYIKNVLDELSQVLPNFEKYKFYFFCATAGIEPQSLQDTYKNKILIQWEDQLGTEPSNKVMNSFLCVFKTHLRRKSKQYNNLFSYPLGIPYKIKELPIIPINERAYNVFYSGNLNKNRLNLYYNLVKIQPKLQTILSVPILYFSSLFEYNKYLRNYVLKLKSLVFKMEANDFSSLYTSSIIKFTKSFEAGFSPDHYAEVLSQSKIVLSPKGFYNTECFRFYEALRQGCIVITEELPITDYYKKDFFIEVKSWKNINTIINSLLNDKQKMNYLSNSSRKYYMESLSPKGVALYIKDKINHIEK